MGDTSSEKLPSWLESPFLDGKHKFAPFPCQSVTDEKNGCWRQEGIFLGLRQPGSGFALICPNILNNKAPTDATCNAMRIFPSYTSQHLIREPVLDTEGLVERPDVLPKMKQLHGHSFRLLQNHTTQRQVILLFDKIQTCILLSRRSQIYPRSEQEEDLHAGVST